MDKEISAVKHERVNFIDAAKAVALFLVVVGHTVSDSSTIFRFIFGFHMPFFFVASGFFFNPDAYPFRVFLKKKARSLLIPYLVFSLLGLIILLILPSWRTGNDILWYLTQYFYLVTPAALGQVWFLICLFMALMLVFGLFRCRLCRNAWSVLLVMVILAIIGTVFIPRVMIPHIGRFPFKIDSAVTASVFVLFGYLIKQLQLFEKIKPWQRLIGLFLLPAVVCLYAVYSNEYVNLCDCRYGNPICYFVAATAGSLWLFDLGFFLQKCRMICRIGKNSLYIFGIHSLFLWLWIKAYGLLTGDNARYLSNIWWVLSISAAAFLTSTIAVKGYTVLTRYVQQAVSRRTKQSLSRSSGSPDDTE